MTRVVACRQGFASHGRSSGNVPTGSDHASTSVQLVLKDKSALSTYLFILFITWFIHTSNHSQW